MDEPNVFVPIVDGSLLKKPKSESPLLEPISRKSDDVVFVPMKVPSLQTTSLGLAFAVVIRKNNKKSRIKKFNIKSLSLVISILINIQPHHYKPDTSQCFPIIDKKC
jgi:hypothetical protein